MFLTTWRFKNAPPRKRKTVLNGRAGPGSRTSPRFANKSRIKSCSDVPSHTDCSETGSKRCKKKQPAHQATQEEPPPPTPWSHVHIADHESIHLFRTVLLPHVIPIYDVFDMAPIFSPDWLEMAQHESFLCAASASVQSDLDLLRGSRGASTDSQTVLRYQVRALKAVRQDVENSEGQIGDETILAVLYLSLVNGQISFTIENHFHRATLWRLVSSRGGIEALGTFAQRTLRRYEPFLVEPQNQPQWTRPKPLARQFENYGDLLRMQREATMLPSGFRTLALEGKLPMETVKALLRIDAIRQSLSAKRYKTCSTNEQTLTSRVPIHYSRAANLIDVLEPEGESVFVKMLARALMLYSTTTFSGIPLCTFIAFRNCFELISMLQNFHATVSAIQEECLCWMWCVAIESWEVGSVTRSLQGERLRVAFSQRFPLLSQSRFALQAVLRRFFFHEGMLTALNNHSPLCSRE